MEQLLVSAFMGALASLPVSLLVVHLQFRVEAKYRRRQAQFDLVCDLAKYKSGPRLAEALNQVPILFSEDPKALELWRAFRPEGNEPDFEAGAKMLQHLAAVVGLGSRIRQSDITAGFAAE